MSETGMDHIRPSDDVTLLESMHRIAELGSVLAVHAENYALVRARPRASAGRGPS
jgi:allantoinase